MRILHTALISLLLSLAFSLESTGEDAERRLPRIQVTALPPHMGTVYANAFTIRPQDFVRPGYEGIDIRFFPVEFGDDGGLLPETTDTQIYSISTNIPARAEGVRFKDGVRDFYYTGRCAPIRTLRYQRNYLPSGRTR